MWSYDGTRVSRETDINPDSEDAFLSDPQLAVFNSKLYFAASNGFSANERELWSWDGTSASMVEDINPSGDGLRSDATFEIFDNKLFFGADDDDSGFDLWSLSADGTLKKEVNAGVSIFTDFAVFQDFLVFRYGSSMGRFFSDGTAQAISDATLRRSPFVFNDKLFFVASQLPGRLLSFNATLGLATEADIQTATGSSQPADPRGLTVFQDVLYFSANTLQTGFELWSYTLPSTPAPTPAPTPTPTPAPTAAPTPMPTPSPTKCDFRQGIQNAVQRITSFFN